MSNKLKCEMMFVLCMGTVSMITVYTLFGPNMTKTKIATKSVQLRQEIRQYLVNTEACRIPDMDPYGPEVKEFILVQKHVKCPEWNLTTYREGKRIMVNRTAVDLFHPNFFLCLYLPYRKMIGSDEEFEVMNEEKRKFGDYVEVTDEFFFVVCIDTNERIISHQTYAVVLRNENLVKFRKSKIKSQDRMPMSVLFLTLESTSRLNSIRHLNWTRQYLKDNLEAVELVGYNKLGLNSLPNILPIMMERTNEEIPNTCDSTFFDRYPFIWKDFNRAGYMTHMGQEGSKYAVFHYMCLGFENSPVDYYMRPYILAMELTNNEGLCSGNTLVIQSMIDNVKEFAETYKDVPYFSFTFYNDATHDDHNGHGLYDLPLLNLLTHLSDRSLLDNTIVMLIGDHGSRFGPIRNTLQGRMEENLPAFHIALPKWFRVKHKDLYENLKENANKLTSNMDIYATFQDIIAIGKGHSTPEKLAKYGTSLFRNISTKRTCADLKIPWSYCMCDALVQTNSNDSLLVEQAANWIVEEINLILVNVSDLCEYLTLSKVARSWKYLRNEDTSVVDLVLQIEVLPSLATFDTSVRYQFDTREITLMGDISRTNKYAGQSDCVAKKQYGVLLERYCYCTV